LEACKEISLFTTFGVRLLAARRPFSPPSLPFFSLLTTFLHSVKKLSQKKKINSELCNDLCPEGMR
jgi:hypothetical protein